MKKNFSGKMKYSISRRWPTKERMGMGSIPSSSPKPTACNAELESVTGSL